MRQRLPLRLVLLRSRDGVLGGRHLLQMPVTQSLAPCIVLDTLLRKFSVKLTLVSGVLGHPDRRPASRWRQGCGFITGRPLGIRMITVKLVAQANLFLRQLTFQKVRFDFVLALQGANAARDL
jgi:hypothetical protein